MANQSLRINTTFITSLMGTMQKRGQGREMKSHSVGMAQPVQSEPHGSKGCCNGSINSQSEIREGPRGSTLPLLSSDELLMDSRKGALSYQTKQS